MKKTKSVKRKENTDSVYIIYFKNQLFYFLIFLFLYFSSCCICLLAGVKKSDINYISVVVFCISSFICGTISGLKNRKNGLLNGVMSVLPSVSLFMLISCILNGFSLGFINIAVSTTLALVVGCIGGICGVNIRIKPKKRGR